MEPVRHTAHAHSERYASCSVCPAADLLLLAASLPGKTSIIESLKFVTTGSLPPLSDGGKSFVHDPKMDGTALVKAQVKLSFVTADDKTVLAIRNFQLTQKKTKREFKGMEAVLQTKDEHGRESSVSHSQTDTPLPLLTRSIRNGADLLLVVFSCSCRVRGYGEAGPSADGCLHSGFGERDLLSSGGLTLAPFGRQDPKDEVR